MLPEMVGYIGNNDHQHQPHDNSHQLLFQKVRRVPEAVKGRIGTGRINHDQTEAQ